MKHLSIPKTGLLFVLPLAFSCCSRNISAGLGDIASYIQERPDSALAALEMIDKDELRHKRDIAYYSLLYAMALDKNYIDTTDLGIIEPAVVYFSKNGSPDEKLKAYYYQGVINYNAGQLNSAAVSFYCAEHYINQSSDVKYAGLLYSMYAEIYKNTYNHAKCIEYVNKARALYTEAGDMANADKCLYDLACAEMGRAHYETADSLFAAARQAMYADTLMSGLILSDYAKNKILMDSQHADDAISLLESKDTGWTLGDYYVYAYAKTYKGDYETCMNIIDNLYACSDEDSAVRDYWLYRILRKQGKYLQAMNCLETTVGMQDRVLYDALSSTVMETIKEFKEQELISERHDSRIRLLTLIIVLLSILILSGLSLILFAKYRHDTRLQLEKMLSAAEDIQSAYIKNFKENLNFIGDLNYIMLDMESKANHNNVTMTRLKKIIPDYSKDTKAQRDLEMQVDNQFNNIITSLRSDFPELKDHDILFFCFHILGFRSITISTIMNISISNMYVKRKRLKDKLAVVNGKLSDKYTSFM